MSHWFGTCIQPLNYLNTWNVHPGQQLAKKWRKCLNKKSVRSHISVSHVLFSRTRFTYCIGCYLYNAVILLHMTDNDKCIFYKSWPYTARILCAVGSPVGFFPSLKKCQLTFVEGSGLKMISRTMHTVRYKHWMQKPAAEIPLSTLLRMDGESIDFFREKFKVCMASFRKTTLVYLPLPIKKKWQALINKK